MKVVPKRVVVRHRRGKLAGLFQILGTIDGENAQLGSAEWPVTIEGLQFPDHVASVDLVTVKTRYAIYAEALVPDSGRSNFNPAQR